jgi:hypothetical protein
MVAILSSTNLYDTCQNLTVPSHKTHYEKVVFFICVPIISKLDSRWRSSSETYGGRTMNRKIPHEPNTTVIIQLPVCYAQCPSSWDRWNPSSIFLMFAKVWTNEVHTSCGPALNSKEGISHSGAIIRCVQRIFRGSSQYIRTHVQEQVIRMRHSSIETVPERERRPLLQLAACMVHMLEIAMDWKGDKVSQYSNVVPHRGSLSCCQACVKSGMKRQVTYYRVPL